MAIGLDDRLIQIEDHPKRRVCFVIKKTVDGEYYGEIESTDPHIFFRRYKRVEFTSPHVRN